MARILVVDDDEDLALILRLNLEKAGHSVRTAGDGLQALEEVRRQAPDAILMDLMMPKFDGAKTYCKLKENPATADIPIVILTGYGHLDQFKDFMNQLGKDGYLEKPAPFDSILQALDRALGVPKPGGP